MIILVILFAFLCIWCPISYCAIRNLYRKFNELKVRYEENLKWTTELEHTVKTIELKRLENLYAGNDHNLYDFIERVRKVQVAIQEAE